MFLNRELSRIPYAERGGFILTLVSLSRALQHYQLYSVSVLSQYGQSQTKWFGIDFMLFLKP